MQRSLRQGKTLVQGVSSLIEIPIDRGEEKKEEIDAVSTQYMLFTLIIDGPCGDIFIHLSLYLIGGKK